MKKKKLKKLYLIGGFIFILLSIFVFFILENKDNYFKELTSNEVIEKVKNEETFALCISKTTCSHCKSYKPKLEKFANKYNITVYYVDIDKYSEDEQDKFYEYVKAKGTPTTIFYKDGDEVSTSTRLVGNASLDKIINKFKSNGFIK